MTLYFKFEKNEKNFKKLIFCIWEMEAFKYYMAIDLKSNDKKDKIKINYVENWSLFNNIEKKLIIKRNIGKLIGFGGLNICKFRNDNKDIVIKIINKTETDQLNYREVFLYGTIESINNAIIQIKEIIGEDNIIIN